MKLFVGTNNKGKMIEIAEGLQNCDVELIQPKDLNLDIDPDETGHTFTENAILKAQAFYSASEMPTIADDSGIMVDAIQDELGVHTRRWGAGAAASDQEWIEYFLNRMKNETNKAARFMCALAYIDSLGEVRVFEGTCEGVITNELEAEYLPGLPISACFKPNGYEAVFSALKVEQKNSTSHRGRAVNQLAQFLNK